MISLFAQVALPLPLDRTFSYLVPAPLQNQIKVGQFVWVPFGVRSLKGIVTQISTDAPNAETLKKIKPLSGIIQSEMVVPAQLLELTFWIASRYACSWGEALASVLPSLKKSSRLKTAVPPIDAAFLDTPPQKISLKLSDEQAAAVAAIENAIAQKTFQPFLLFGVTSSGKTEVFLKAIEFALRQNRQSLFLVPQIALCVPFLSQLKQRFGDRVGMWHFQVAPGAKNTLYQKIQSGEVKIIVGARSALFAPYQNLGVIILDEEHDNAYKQEEKPRYHARETALQLGKLHRSALVLGSATPSIESFYKAQKKEFTLLELKTRVGLRKVPEITIVDRKKYRQQYHPFTPDLKEKINLTLQRKEQIVLGLNRRGFSTYVICMLCAFVWQCPNCKLPLIHHQREKETENLFDGNAPAQQHFLQCHYCFCEQEMPTTCKQCSSEAIHFGGFGTQKIVQELKKIFPYARVLRLDRDSLNKKKSGATLFETFKNEEADILVGTQMVTQGYDFPKVTLVGIVDADTALFHPDFRAAERTFQWVVQAAGRSGRNPTGGIAVVQTSMPEHYALQCALTHNYRAFYEQEIALRKELHYPPFRRLLLLHLQGPPEKEIVLQEALRLKKIFTDEAGLLRSPNHPHTDVEMLGPGPSPKEWINKQLRWQLLLKCATVKSLLRCTALAKTFQAKHNVRFTIDVDPNNVL